MQHALSRLNTFLVGLTKAYLLGKAFIGKFMSVEPGVGRSEAGVSMNLILDRLVDREHIAFLAELDSHRRPDTFGQSEIGIRVEENQCQRLSSL